MITTRGTKERRKRVIFHISDLHFGRYTKNGYNQNRFEDYVKNYLEIHGYPIDYLVISGDITSTSDKKSKNEYNKFLIWVERIKKYFKNIILVPGNHDNKYLEFKEEKGKYIATVDCHNRFKEKILEIKFIINPYSKDLENDSLILFPSDDDHYRIVYDKRSKLVFVLLCSAKRSKNGVIEEGKKFYQLLKKEEIGLAESEILARDLKDFGKIDASYLRNITEGLNTFKEKEKILNNEVIYFVILHHPIKTNPEEDWPSILGTEEFKKGIKPFGIKYILHGHVHQLFFGNIDELTYIGASSLTGKTKRKKSNGFILIRIDYNEDGIPFLEKVFHVAYSMNDPIDMRLNALKQIYPTA